MTPEEHRAFWRNVQFTVDKDVVRTDRNNQFFRGDDNPNVESMRYRVTRDSLCESLRLSLTPLATVQHSTQAQNRGPPSYFSRGLSF